MQKKILVLVSNPKGTTNLELLPEINKLKEALRRSVNRERFVVEWEVAVRQSDLRHHILDVKPQIIHFCGHGTEQGLVLGDDETGKAKVVPNEVLTDLLRAFADLVECVVLNACDSEPLANDLVQHLNYVIGMNQEVRDDAAIAFAEGFYDTLGAGESYERAFEIGRNAVLGKATLRHAPDAPSRRAEVLGQDGKPVKVQNREHLIPVLKINPNPTPIKPLWLAPEVERQVVRDLLEVIESGFNTIKLFHTDEPIVLKDQYIPVQVTLERRYKHSVETIGGYTESEAELRQIYAMKGSSGEEIQEEIKRQQVDWEEAKQQHSRIVVLADPGMGKSTLLRREVVTSVQQAYQALAEGKPVNDITIPLFIRLSSLADEVEKMPTSEAILKLIQERHFALLKEHENAEVVTFLNAFLKKQLLNGKASLLLDALDEVPDGKRQKLLEKLNEFAKGNQTNPCPIVGTSRIVGYGGRFVDGAKDVEIVPFTQKQTEEYIEKWFEYAPLKDESASARGLIQALRERPQLAGLAQNPLLLSLICSLYQQDYLTLPVRRCQLYEQAVNYMLGQWSTDNQRQSANEGWILAKKELLEALAYQFSCESKQLFSFGELRKKLEKYLKGGNASTDLEGVKAADLIKELCEQDGILQRWSAEDDRLPIERRRYLFLHRTFQEYLTASYLSHVDEDKIEFEKLFWNYDWHETISLMAGLMYEPIDLIQRIINTKDDIFQTQLLLAGRCIAECGELSDPLVDETIDRIYQFWRKYPDAEFIRSVVVAIAQTSSRMLENLQRIFTRSDDSLKKYTIAIFGRIGTPVTTEVLISVLKKDNESSNVKENVIRALANLHTSEVIEILISLIKDNEEQGIRYTAVEALGQICDSKVIEALIIVMAMDKDAEIRRRAIEALTQINTPQALRAIISALEDSDHNVKIAASNAFRKVSLPKSLEAATVKALIPLLTDKDSNVRTTVAFSLEKISTPQAIEALRSALGSQDIAIKMAAAGILSKHGCYKATEILKSALKDEDVKVRQQAALRVNANNPELLTASIAALNDKNWEVRLGIVTALGEVNQVEAVDALIRALADPVRLVRGQAALSLKSNGKIKSIEVTTALISTLNFEYARLISPQVKDSSDFCGATSQSTATIHWIVGALGELENSVSVPALSYALLYTWEHIKILAAIALGKVCDSNAAPSLITALLNDQDKNVKTEAAKALDTIAMVNTLEQLLLLSGSNVYKSEVFSLARRLAVRFTKAGSPFIPVYPELLPKADNILSGISSIRKQSDCVAEGNAAGASEVKIQPFSLLGTRSF